MSKKHKTEVQPPATRHELPERETEEKKAPPPERPASAAAAAEMELTEEPVDDDGLTQRQREELRAKIHALFA